MIEVITNFHTLLRLARELAEAEKRGHHQEIEKARIAHDAYVECCKMPHSKMKV